MSEGWKRQLLGDVLDVASGQVDPTIEPYCDMPHIGGENIESHTGRILNVSTAKDVGMTSGKYLFSGEDILYSKIRPNLNKVAAPAFAGICSADIYPLRPKAGHLLREFLVYLLRSQDFIAYTEKHSSRTNIPKVNRECLLNYEAILPSLAEQRRIAEVLDRAEALRAKRRAALTQLDSLTQSLFLDLFGDPATNPKGWPVRIIRDLLESASYGTSEKSGTTGAFPVLRMNNITRTGGMDFTDLKFMDLEERDYERYLVRRGDVLFNRTNSAELVGKTGIFRDSKPMAYAGYLIRLRVTKDNDPEFLSAFLNSGYSKRMLRGMCKSIIGMANINATEIQAMKIPQPPLRLQQEFARRVTAVETLKTAQRASLAELDALFASLQHRAFRGELWNYDQDAKDSSRNWFDHDKLRLSRNLR